jgi:hypothetical protein
MRIESTQIRWFLDSQVRRLDHMSGGQWYFKGGYQASVHSDQMVLMMARQVGWTG